MHQTLPWRQTLRDHLRLLPQGGPGFVQIALTNACNARCQFCGFARIRPEAWVMAEATRLRRGLATLAASGVRYLALTGGEPLLHPHLLEILHEAQSLGFHLLLCSNGSLLTQEQVAALAQAGVGHLLISIDAASAQVHENHRGFPGLCQKLQSLVPEMPRQGMTPVASVTVSRLWSDFDALGQFLVSLGFRAVTFSYPTMAGHWSSWQSGDAASISYTAQELADILRRLQSWRRRAPLVVLNPDLGLTELQRQLHGQPPRFPCLAGYKYFYLDWHLNVSCCHIRRQPLGRLEDFAALPRRRPACHACLTDCYRDASVQQYPAVAVAAAWQAVKQGRWGQALGKLFSPENFLALGAAWQSRRWFSLADH
ncbi:MAG: radical SAM protein [Desulfobacca sp.]|uniref:radical SAM protein n=1 Tax=Desulfobacca sp. TaxID=2067990 RepID=UPI004049DBC9